MNAKTFDLERLRAQLTLWDAEITHLEETIQHLGPEFQTAVQSEADDMLVMLEKELAALKQLQDEADQELRRMEQAGDPEWRIQGERAERALARLGTAFEQSRTRFGE